MKFILFDFFHAPFITHMMLVDVTFLIIIWPASNIFYNSKPHLILRFSALYIFAFFPSSRLFAYLAHLSSQTATQLHFNFTFLLLLPCLLSFSSFRPFLFSSQISFVRRAAKLLTRIKERGEVEVERRIERCKGYCWSSSGWESPDWSKRWKERSVTTTMNRLYPLAYRWDCNNVSAGKK